MLYIYIYFYSFTFYKAIRFGTGLKAKFNVTTNARARILSSNYRLLFDSTAHSAHSQSQLPSSLQNGKERNCIYVYVYINVCVYVRV